MNDDGEGSRLDSMQNSSILLAAASQLYPHFLVEACSCEMQQSALHYALESLIDLWVTILAHYCL